MIKLGSNGEEVKKIQERLGLTVDGIFGEMTKKAVVEFQQKNGLKADGIVGDLTRKKMFGSQEDQKGKPQDFHQGLVQNAKLMVETYKKNKVRYNQSKREFGLGAKFSDCSSAVSTILKLSGVEDKLKSTNTRSMREEIAAKGGKFRKNDPRPGDIMMWGGHVALVTGVDDDSVHFAHMGRSGATIGKVKLVGRILESESTWGSGGFIGFWTLS